MDEEDEHNLSDDAFDYLPDSTLRELEHNAFLSTQQAQAQTTRPAAAQHVLSKPVSNGPSLRQDHLQKNGPLQRPIAANVQHLLEGDGDYDGDSFDYMDDDDVNTPVEEVQAYDFQQHVPSDMSQREQWRQDRFGKPGAAQSNNNARTNPQSRPVNFRQQPQQPPNEHYPVNNNHVTPRGPPQTVTPNHEALLARIEHLLKQNDQLTTELKSATAEVVTKQGEISIIRENKSKESKIFDRQINALKKSMQEEATKHKTALQALTNRNEQVLTNNTFLKHELDQEAEKAKLLQQRLKEKTGTDKSAGQIAVTPKKAPANSLRDGFDDDEIMAVSPSRSARRSKPTTPTAGKRKRKADVQSPIRPLVLRQSGTVLEPNQPNRSEAARPKTERVVPIFRRDLRAERNLQFVQTILNYQVKTTRKSLVETLINYHFPSDPSKPFSAIVLEATSKLKGERLPADFLHTFTGLWARALEENYYDCISLLIEVFNFVIDLDMSVIDNATITALLPVVENSAWINGKVRFGHSPVNHSTYGQFRTTPQSVLNHKVDGHACMQLLYKIACIVEDEFPLIDLFWRSITTDFVLMMLNPWQPVTDTVLMFHLLRTSVSPTTFGNVCTDEPTQRQMEGHIIERVSYLIWETPKPDEGVKPLTRSEICRYHIEAMDLLLYLAIDSSLPPHDDRDHIGSKLIAHHPRVIARIVRTLYEDVAAMYTLSSSHALHAELVNKGVRLLYHITRVHGDEIDMQTKLSAVNGAINKHRVVLTRLAFSEGIYIDRLITDENVTMATAMLEDSVTPDEADQLIEAFPNFNGRKPATQS